MLVNSLLRLTNIDLGFAPDRLWTVDFVAPRSLYPQREQVGPLAVRMADALRRVPGASRLVHPTGDRFAESLMTFA